MNAREETKKHITRVSEILTELAKELDARGSSHDASKLKSPEVEIFDAYTEKLKNVTYGSEEYKKYLAEMKPALDHHYAENKHHPEYYRDGIGGMNLIDLVEMWADWKAASERHADGDFDKSIEHNKERFAMPDMLCKIFINTDRDYDFSAKE